jgi:hypothetical protein
MVFVNNKFLDIPYHPYLHGRLIELQKLITQHQQQPDILEARVWEAIIDLINCGLSTQAIGYARKYQQDDQVVSFDVPTANLWSFYSEIVNVLEGLPEGLINISRKRCLTRLLRNTSCRRITVRYQGRVTRAVVWRVDCSFHDWLL